MSRLLLPAAVCIFLTLPASVLAFEKPKHDDIPDLDKRRPSQQIPAARLEAAARLKARLPNVHVDFDPLQKTPKHVVSGDGFLSGPHGRGKGIAPETAASIPDHDPLHPLKGFLKEHKGLFGHDDEALKKARLKRQDITPHNGLRSYAWQQELDGLDVVGAALTSHITKDGELVSVSTEFITDLEQSADNGTPNRAALQAAPTVTASEAVRLAAESIGETVIAEEIVPILAEPEGKEMRQTFKAGSLPGEAEVKLVWLPLSENALKLCWEAEITRPKGGERFRLHIDADTGEVLVRRRLTLYLADASYRVYTSDSPSPFSPSYQTPSTNQPPLRERSFLTFAAVSTNASPTGWVHPADNETRGNNVDAHLDRNADDLPDLPRPHGNPFRVFDFPLDFTRPPSAYGDAAVVQLFYWCNWMHDKLYELGFTETAGNFQKDNFARGGLGNDLVLADAQDGSGTDNANFTPTDDGKPPRIQMYVFSGPQPNRDGDLDAEIILHEYTHGLSTRLVGGGMGLDALQSAGMGEGWSDFYALAMLSESNDDPHAAYAMGGYATKDFFGLKENYYFGVRRYPYSTDLSKNPLTFKDIDPNQISPHAGVPLSPIDPFNPLFAAEVHSQGEVWCVTLWDMRANLVDRYGFAGSRLALQLVTDAMKLTPRNPTFLQARDAIILADQVNNGGANFMEIWRAFAKRGMGFSAVASDANTTFGIIEEFDLPDSLLVVPSTAFISAGAVGGGISPGCKTYVITNNSDAPVTWSAAASQGWITVTPDRATLAPFSGATVTVCLNGAAIGVGSQSGTVTFRNETTGRVQEREVNVRIMAFTTMPFSDDFESGMLQPYWQVTGTAAYRVQVSDQNTPRGRYHLTLDNTGNGINSRNEVTLGIDLAGYTNVVLRFWGKQFGDEPDGPPPTPFIGGADFDGIAVSTNGIEWYEVQSMRELRPGVYSEWRVDLDEAISRYGLSYNKHFRIRFNEFDNFSIPLDGIALDDISITGLAARRLVVGLPPLATEGEGPLTGQVLTQVPRPTDIEVRLFSSDTSKVRVPDRIILPAGSTQAVFSVTILDNGLPDGTQTVTVNATAADFFVEPGRISIRDSSVNRLSVSIWPRGAREGDGLYRKMGTVKAAAKAPRDVHVKLASSDPNEARVPAEVIIPAGEHKAEFDILVVDDTVLDGTTVVTITAHVDNWEDGRDTLAIEDNDVPGLRIFLPETASEGNGVLTNAGQIRLLASLKTNLTVTLVSSDETELKVPSSITIPAGEFTANFDLTIIDDSEPDDAQTVTVTASAPFHPAATAIMEILDDETPPMPYQPRPADRSSNLAITTDLSWLGGVGEILVNGGFETGQFGSWFLDIGGLGGFVINDGKLDPQSFDGPSPPYEGNFSVVTDQTGGGYHFMYQDVFIPARIRGAKLSWVDKIRNHSTQYDLNQYFRVEVRDTQNQVLEVLFNTPPGFPLTNNWTTRTFDLTAYRGQTVRIAFIEEDHQGYFNVHLDNVSVRLEDNGLTTFDVYLGTNATLTATNFLGNTATNFWDLPNLELSTSYYWRILARRGTTTTAGPVWQFSTRSIGGADHFQFGPIETNQIVGQPFAATITARDDLNNVATNFLGTVQLRAYRGLPNSSAVVVTELDPGNNKRVEFENVSGRRLDVSGWEVSLYDTSSWPNPRNVVTLPTNTIVPPGAIFVVSALGVAPGKYPAFFTGTNLVWNFDIASNYIAVLLRDTAGQPVDFMCAAEAKAAQVSVPISISQDDWSGPPIAANTNSSLTYQRVGRVDNANAADWRFLTNSIGRKNTGLQVPLDARFPLAISPPAASNFVQGAWSGELAFQAPASPITIVAEDTQRRFGVAGPFAASVANDISLTVVDSPDLLTFGEDLTYHFTVANSGPGEATGIVLSNRLPAGVDFVSVASSQGACTFTAGHLRCDLGQLAANARATVTLVVNPSQAGVITNTAYVTRTGADTFAGNNTATAESTVVYPVLFLTAPSVITEGNTTTNYVITLRLSSPSRLSASVEFRTEDMNATAGVDYTPTNGVLTFLPGETSKIIRVEVKGDRLDEPLERFFFKLSSPTNCVIAVPEVICRVNDDDPAPSLSIDSLTVVEPSPGVTTNVIFNVRLSAVSAQTVFVNYTTTNGTALADRDFFTEFGLLEFPPGTTNRSFSVRVIGDTLFESNEVFGVRLFAPVNALGTPLGTVTIIDNGFVDLDHFKWGHIASPQIAGRPFEATITARDGRDEIFPGFSGTLRVYGISSSRTASIGSGTNTWEMPMGTLFHDARTQIIYLADEVGAPGKINALALNVTTAPGQTMSNWTIRVKHTALSNYATAAWETNDWTIVYHHDETIQSIGWNTFFFDQPFDYDGTNNIMVDLSFDNSTYTTDGLCASVPTQLNRSLFFQTDGAFGDPAAWSGTAQPPPLAAKRVPQARFTVETFVNIEPQQTGPFVNGVWTGQVTVLEPGTNIILRAVHESGRNGTSAGFRVDPAAGQLPCTIRSVAVSGNNVRLTFDTIAGQTYRVEATPSLATPQWTTIVDNVRGTGSTLEALDPAAASQRQRFYRVRVLP